MRLPGSLSSKRGNGGLGKTAFAFVAGLVAMATFSTFYNGMSSVNDLYYLDTSDVPEVNPSSNEDKSPESEQFQKWLQEREKGKDAPGATTSPEMEALKEKMAKESEEKQQEHLRAMKELEDLRGKIQKEMEELKQAKMQQSGNVAAGSSATETEEPKKVGMQQRKKVAAGSSAKQVPTNMETEEVQGHLIPFADQERKANAYRKTLRISPVVNPDIKDFEHQDRVVIASKIHGHYHFPHLETAICSLQEAYNNRVNYDIIVFSTIPLIDDVKEDYERLKKMVAPAKFEVVVDNPGLHEQVRSLTKEEQEDVLKRCNNTKTIEELHWGAPCSDNRTRVKMSYNWQAEFRSLHIWTNPALKPYKYMMWIDADVFSINVWKQDPVAYMIRNDMVLFFANWPKGSARGPELTERLEKGFKGLGVVPEGQRVCGMKLVDGHLDPGFGTCDKGPSIPDVHGMFHITNLDFMRSPPAQQFFREYIGTSHFSRKFDDQGAVTLAGGVLAPNRSCDMWSHGVDLGIYHNSDIMGKRKRVTYKFTRYWKEFVPQWWPEGPQKCKALVNG